MIINSINNLRLYTKQFPVINDIIQYIEKHDLSKIPESKIEITDKLYLVSIKENQVEPTIEAPILEAHKKWIDIHCTIIGKDRIIFKSVDTCKNIERDYDVVDDYILFKESADGSALIEEGYFCLIEPNMAHMALCGQGIVSKIVFKARQSQFDL